MTLTAAQLAHADVQSAAHHLALAQDALSRAQRGIESCVDLGRLRTATRHTSAALGAVHVVQRSIRIARERNNK